MDPIVPLFAISTASYVGAVETYKVLLLSDPCVKLL